jgi:pyruvate,water dikinase
MMEKQFIVSFTEIGKHDLPLVGGKNASLGEMINSLKEVGINVPNGFAVTTESYRLFLKENKLSQRLKNLMDKLDKKECKNLQSLSTEAKKIILASVLPQQVNAELIAKYNDFSASHGYEVAVRSSATAEDLPSTSFAGLHDSFLNVVGSDLLIQKIIQCYASLYNARAIKYRVDNAIEHADVAISVGIQQMVRSDKACSGVLFTIEPDSGFKNLIVINSCWGLGENIVQGAVTPDEFHVFKSLLEHVEQPIIYKKIGSKAKTMVYNEAGQGVMNTDTPIFKQTHLSLSDAEIIQLAKWAVKIEKHYGFPMDIEWAKDGISHELYIVQARPETVFSTKNVNTITVFQLKEHGKMRCSGNAVGGGIRSGIARVLIAPSASEKLNPGEILVTDITSPDWDPIMKKAAAIITNKGGRTSHAAIVARELNALALVGVGDATTKIKDGDWITLDNSSGKIGCVYEGKSTWTEETVDLKEVKMPKTKPMLILSDPDKAYKLSFYPNSGVGLMRIEFVISNTIGIHPMALVKFDSLKDGIAKEKIATLTENYSDKKEYFVDKLSQSIATIAAAFYPKQVIVRMSDFKSNEYANLLGGNEFEKKEENPMIGFRGASRYYDIRYSEGFELECRAMKRVRNQMGFTNLKLMIPFCRTVEEGKKVIALMEKNGLKRGDDGLEIYVMAEIPSNVILAEEFASIFDGFSIGSNDLTQLILGIDRDASEISHLFDENNPAVKSMIGQVIRTANRCRIKIGLCGQAPSDDPEFASFLIRQGITSISFNPDALLKGIENMNKAEELTF